MPSNSPKRGKSLSKLRSRKRRLTMSPFTSTFTIPAKEFPRTFAPSSFNRFHKRTAPPHVAMGEPGWGWPSANSSSPKWKEPSAYRIDRKAGVHSGSRPHSGSKTPQPLPRIGHPSPWNTSVFARWTTIPPTGSYWNNIFSTGI